LVFNFKKIIKFFKDNEHFFKKIALPQKTELVLKNLKNKFQKKINSYDGDQVYNDDLWRIGFVCKKDCYYITTEILKCLERNGYEWKIISSSYKIKCRRKKFDQKEDNRYSNINVLIQIFSVI